MKTGLNTWQRRVFFLCWASYTLAYLTRINLSVAIPLIEADLMINKTAIGLIGSTFFWIYAAGQLINGRLGDRLKSRLFIFVGLFISAAANIAFSFAQSPIFMAMLWGFNGYFQSILWGSLIRMLHRWFPKKERPIVGLYIFSSVLIGFVLTWGALPRLASLWGWRGIFLIPGAILGIYSLIWLLFARNGPEEVGLTLEEIPAQIVPTAGKSDANPPAFWRFIVSQRLYMLALCGIPLGFIREGIGLWTPTLLVETFRLDLATTMGAALMIPIFNFLGILAVRVFIKRFQGREALLAALLFAGAAISLALLRAFACAPIYVYVPLLGSCSLLLYGSTSILTSVIPLGKPNPSTVAGFLDFSIYLGAGLSGFITGMVLRVTGWSVVLIVWLIAALAAGLFAYLYSPIRSRKPVSASGSK